MSEFLAEINWSPLWISLKTGFAATVIAFFLGIFFARLVMKMKPVSRGILDGILTMPLVLPNSGRFHSAFAVQSETSVWGISAG